MKWVTRERPKIDRIACPWLIRRFIEPDAEFLYVPADQVLDIAEAEGAIPYDIPGVEFSHVGEKCSFDAFLDKYDLTDPALLHLAEIVRGADTSRLNLTPQSAGLFAISLGLSANFHDDHQMLEHGITMYDALYAWCHSCQAECHNWPPAGRGYAGSSILRAGRALHAHRIAKCVTMNYIEAKEIDNGSLNPAQGSSAFDAAA